MDLKDLNVFLAVYEYRNMTQAAKALYLSPQSVSNIISKLETFFGVTLFTRTVSGSEPTHEAYLLKTNAQKIIDDFERLESTFSASELNRKVLKIGAILGVFRYLTIDFIKAFYERYPSIKLDIIEQHEFVIEEACWNETVELIINGCNINLTKFDTYPLYSCKYCVIINKEHPLAKKESIAFSDLNNIPLGLLRCTDYHLSKFYNTDFIPNILIVTSDMDYLMDIAESNTGISVSIDYFYTKHPSRKTVVRYFDDESCTWNCAILVKKNKKLSEEALLFMDFATDWISSHDHHD